MNLFRSIVVPLFDQMIIPSLMHFRFVLDALHSFCSSGLIWWQTQTPWSWTKGIDHLDFFVTFICFPCFASAAVTQNEVIFSLIESLNRKLTFYVCFCCRFHYVLINSSQFFCVKIWQKVEFPESNVCLTHKPWRCRSRCLKKLRFPCDYKKLILVFAVRSFHCSILESSQKIKSLQI